MGSVLECLWTPFECGGLIVSSSSSSGPIYAIKTDWSVADTDCYAPSASRSTSSSLSESRDIFEDALSSLLKRARFGGLVRFVDLCIALEGELRRT